MSEAAIFRPRVRALVWLLVGVSALGTVVAILVGQRVASPLPGARDSYAEAPLGSRAFLETLEALGMHVLRERRADFEGVRAPLVLIEPDMLEAIVDGEPHRLEDALTVRAEAGLASVVILPKWSWDLGGASPDPEAGRILAVVLPGASIAHAGALNEPMADITASGPLGAYELTLPFLQHVIGSSADVLLGSEGRALVLRRSDGVLVVTDPDLVHNWNLHRADHARLLVDVLREAGASDAVAVDEVFHGHGERRSLASALGEHPTVLFTVQALFVLFLVVWIGSRRFGPARDAAPRPHGPAESIAVSAFVLAEGRPLATLAGGYVHALVAELAERLGLPPGRPPREQAAHVDRMATRRGEPARAAALLLRAEALARGGALPNDALSLAREAHALRSSLLSRT